MLESAVGAMGYVIRKLNQVRENVSSSQSRFEAIEIIEALILHIYNWNILPVGQLLWLKELQSYVDFPPMQDPASYNLSQVMEAVKREAHRNPSG